MNLGSGLSANPHSSHPSLEEELEPQTLDGNPTLAVWNNAILTVGSESLIILGEYIQRLAILSTPLLVMGHILTITLCR